LKITVDAAREYFAHPSQQVMGITPETLPDGFDYRADGPVCLIFHPAMWPRVFGVHIAAKPEGRGRLVEPVGRVMREFWAENDPLRVVSWVSEDNRAVIALARRCGAVIDGAFDGVVMLGWRL